MISKVFLSIFFSSSQFYVHCWLLIFSPWLVLFLIVSTSSSYSEPICQVFISFVPDYLFNVFILNFIYFIESSTHKTMITMTQVLILFRFLFFYSNTRINLIPYHHLPINFFGALYHLLSGVVAFTTTLITLYTSSNLLAMFKFRTAFIICSLFRRRPSNFVVLVPFVSLVLQRLYHPAFFRYDCATAANAFFVFGLVQCEVWLHLFLLVTLERITLDRCFSLSFQFTHLNSDSVEFVLYFFWFSFYYVVLTFRLQR